MISLISTSSTTILPFGLILPAFLGEMVPFMKFALQWHDGTHQLCHHHVLGSTIYQVVTTTIHGMLLPLSLKMSLLLSSHQVWNTSMAVPIDNSIIFSSHSTISNSIKLHQQPPWSPSSLPPEMSPSLT